MEIRRQRIYFGKRGIKGEGKQEPQRLWESPYSECPLWFKLVFEHLLHHPTPFPREIPVPAHWVPPAPVPTARLAPDWPTLCPHARLTWGLPPLSWWGTTLLQGSWREWTHLIKAGPPDRHTRGCARSICLGRCCILQATISRPMVILASTYMSLIVAGTVLKFCITHIIFTTMTKNKNYYPTLQKRKQAQRSQVTFPRSQSW